MALTGEDLRQKIESQKSDNPAMYGGIDFGLRPERLLDGQPELSDLRNVSPGMAERLLADRDLIGRMEAYTMLGDTVADPYAALMPQYGFRPLVEMLVAACDKGVDAVPDAPPELSRFIAAMEDTPAWVDMKLVEKGARLQRNAMANFAPWAIRGGFIATFMNKYAALPMALTGTLSNKTAARRIKETATFFGTSTLPGALRRFGPGFKAAAMVRLMHSMVRFNVLSKGRWDQRVFGIPIPQVDQMPAGLISDFFISSKALREKRGFTADERAQIELSRYRCFLLGLPQDLLADTPAEIVDAWNARMVTLRSGFDDATCGALLRATMEAQLGDTSTPKGAMRERFEKSFSKVYFLQNFCGGDERRARDFGVRISGIDRARAAAVGLHVVGRMRAYEAAGKVPVLREIAAMRLTGRLQRYLGTLGHAEFTSDGAKYKPAASGKEAEAPA
ncbi:oxygenase MpaB family protein [Novosphingobium sp. ZN18A2]|uniref:oxygenase MpaB family protein n=1 Tax=Novosphingobium sp. ZN18A2 TaxID=3079861 RepID=UPI0030CF5467